MSESEERYPRIGQVVTVVAVRNLEAVVLGATIIAAEGGRYDLQVEEADSLNAEPLVSGGRVKLLYGSGPMVWRLGGSVEVVHAEEGRLSVLCSDPPRPGERREFIRAEMVLTFLAQRTEVQDPDEVLAAMRGNVVAADDPRWKVQLVDLSGSGMKFRMDDVPVADGLFELRIRLKGRPPRPMDLVARVVRAVPIEGGGSEVALRFERVTDAQQDALINLAFRVRYEQLGA